MKLYRTLCSKCSTPINPEFRDHKEDGNAIICLHCGYELFIIEEESYYILEEGNGTRKPSSN